MSEGIRFSRNEGLIGALGQGKIGSTIVAIVGLGGLGSHIAQQLAYLGVRTFCLIDFDIVTESSLNRLIGAIEDDVVNETLKVDAAKRTILSIVSSASVTTVSRKLSDPEAQVAISGADVVFGCLDDDRHRIELLEICAGESVPYFDLATDVVGQDQSIYGGRVVFCDGSRCLVCLPEVIDQQSLAVSGLSEDQRGADRRIYGVTRGALSGTGPSVVSINGVVASLAVTEFMVEVTQLRPAVGQLTYRADRGIVTRSADPGSPDCYYCRGLWNSQRSEWS
jgi:molybdopterin-synthase adenylyltransferase